MSSLLIRLERANVLPFRADQLDYERIQHTDPTGWRDYLEELAEVTPGEPGATAEQEWPEYPQ